MSFILPDDNGKTRDANGRFVKKGTPPEDTIKTDFKSDGPELVPAANTSKSQLDEPLVSLIVQNPFKKLLHWLDSIRKKQTTTFDFKISIPLIALPIFLIVIGSAFSAFFNWGKSVAKKEDALKPTPTVIVITSAPQPVIISKVGTIKATYQLTVTNPVISVDPSATPTPTPTPIPYRYVLSTGSTQFIFLNPVSGISLNSYLNQRVLVTGLYEDTTNSLKINKTTDIEVLP